MEAAPLAEIESVAELSLLAMGRSNLMRRGETLLGEWEFERVVTGRLVVEPFVAAQVAAEKWAAARLEIVPSVIGLRAFERPVVGQLEAVNRQAAQLAAA